MSAQQQHQIIELPWLNQAAAHRERRASVISTQRCGQSIITGWWQGTQVVPGTS
jgi:hypothetical protein